MKPLSLPKRMSRDEWEAYFAYEALPPWGKCFSNFLGKLIKLIPGLLLALLLLSGQAWGAWEPDYERLATAIYHAEGGAKTRHPYGILTKYKHTTPRQACLNTLHTKYRAYLLLEGQGKATKEGYLRYLSSKYAPVGALNDPLQLNQHWLTNVMFYYDKGGA